MNEAKSRTYIFWGALASLLIGPLLGYKFGGYLLAAIIAGAILIGLFFMRRVLMPPSWGRTRIRLASLAIFSTIVLASLNSSGWLPSAISSAMKHFGVPVEFTSSNWVQVIIISIGAVTVILLNLIWKEPSILPAANMAESKLPQNKDFITLRNRFCDFMLSEITRYDRDVNWSDSEYTTLEAEVEMERMGALRPLIVKNLVAAIRKDKKTRSFLVVGDPGSGKSVSLRRLYRELHKEYEKEEPEKAVVPVYINLREWNGPKIPSDEDIADYVFHYLKQWTGREGRTFLDNWYEQMLKDGGFFFILDSFDEMPPVLDCDDRSSLLKDISRAFDRFFQDLHMCRGVLASRPFRQPVGFRGRKLSIRPFREIQVRKTMKTWLIGKGFDADIIVKKLFKDRPELSPAIRNPFTGELISQYVSHHNGEIPSTYYEIFESYIGKRLEEDAKYIEEQGLEQEQLLECAAVLSWEMYNNSDIGLEAELSYLQNTVERAQLIEEVYAMRDSHLIRLGGVNNQRLSFVHRRFAEYFFVKALRENHGDVKLDSIPGDSRWRVHWLCIAALLLIQRLGE